MAQHRRHEPYGRRQLARLIEPTSIAVVGASEREGALGQRTMANLAHFGGRLLPVNPRARTIAGRTAYPSLAALPEPPDCVVIALPSAEVEATLLQAAGAGAGSAIIFASGFAETGSPDGRARQLRISEIAATSGMRVVGPNTAGLANLVSGAHAGFPEFPHAFARRPGAIAIASQSGALGLALAQAAEHGASITHVLTAGNSADVDVADYVSYLAEDPDAGAIALAFEGLSEPERLAEAARRARGANKPVVAFKLARSDAGREAALSHTGCEAGAVEDYEALFRAAGIIEVSGVEQLVETATFFAKTARLPVAARSEARVAILSSSGGTGIIAADTAFACGVALPQPQGATLAVLQATIPAFGAARNPCDATAQATSNPESLGRCAAALLSDPAFDALVMPVGRASVSSQFQILSEAGLRYGKPVCLVWMSQWLEGPGAREAEQLPGLSLFRSMRSCFAALAAWGRPPAA